MKTNKFLSLLFVASFVLFSCQDQSSTKSIDDGVIVNPETNEISLSNTTDEAVTLTYAFKKGVKVENVYTITMEYEMMGQKMPSGIIMEGSFEILDVDSEGSADIKYAITSMKMDMAAQGLNFDSKDDKYKSNLQFAPLYKIIDKSIITKIKNNGEVLGADYSEIMAEMGDEFEALKPQFEQNVNQFSQSSFPFLTDKPVKAGDKYEGDVIDQSISGINVKTANAYTVRSISEDKSKVILEMDATMELNVVEALMGMEVSMNEGTIKGWLLLDLSQGLVVKSALKSTLDFTTEMQGQKNDMVIVTDMIMNIK